MKNKIEIEIEIHMNLVFQKYQKPLVRYIARRCEREDAKDLAQTVFLKYFEKIKRTGNCESEPWETIQKFADGETSTFAKARRKDQKVVEIFIALAPERRRQETVRDALYRVIEDIVFGEPDLREGVVHFAMLRYLERKNHEEIAVVMDVSLRTVERHQNEVYGYLRKSVDRNVIQRDVNLI